MEAKLTDLVNRLKSSAHDNLKAVILYGSAVSGEFREGHSDLNVLCLVNAASANDLEHLHSVAEWWTRQGNAAPLVFTLDNLSRYPRTSRIAFVECAGNSGAMFQKQPAQAM